MKINYTSKNYDSPKLQETEYHGSMDLLERVSTVITAISTYRLRNDNRVQLKLLYDYYSHLYPLLSDEEVKECAEMFQKASKLVSELHQQEPCSPEANGFLFHLELELKKLHHLHGLYTKIVARENLGNAVDSGGD